ncbi:MAG: hypothetical protein BWY29_01085 [Microgenomates group bacterium ADurb.Bin238]|nr:MAG: hypothetical protein BWY29_01085 [Microgenomates group bacterium ADurb.Bin238]
MFQFPDLPGQLTSAFPIITSGEFPHSDITGSQFVDNSPAIFAVFHVLLRL